MAQVTDDLVQRGREALERHAWQEAFDLLSRADAEQELTAADLELLAQAGWWAAHLPASIAARERAYAAALAAGDTAGAADAALKVARDHGRSLAVAQARAWFARAERLLEGIPESPTHGSFARDQAMQALMEGRLDRALERATEAVEIGSRTGDPNVQALAIHMKGQVLVAMGRVQEGMALEDEATMAAVSGELRPDITGVIYCNMIATCTDMADYRRAGEWTEAAKRWCDRQSINGFPGVCRVHRAEIMRLRGSWLDAEEEATRACTELSDFGFFNIASDAFYELGEIRLRMGEVALAEEAFRQANEMGRDPMPGLALLRLAEGKRDAAWAAIRRAVDEAPEEPLRRARLLPAFVRIALDVGELDRARTGVEELESTAATFQTPALEAMAATYRGALRTSEGDPSGAQRSLRRGVELWREIDLPYEAAEARALLGAAYRAEGDEDAALLELDAARAAFERLGAPRDVQRMVDLMGTADAAGAGGERVERAFMFTDIVRSTNLVEAIGDEAWADLVRWHDQLLRVCFERHGGQEVDHAGDGFFVAFEDASRALACAVEIQRKLVEHRRSAGFAPQVRIGVHVAQAAKVGDAYLGKGVHEAARIGSLAGGGDIVASEDAARVAGGGFPASEPREVTLKGIGEPVSVVTIAWQEE